MEASRESQGPAKVKKHHDEAFRYINNALKFDEQGKIRDALQLYHKGLRSLIVGISVHLIGAGPEMDKAKSLQDKMKATKQQVQERVEALSVLNGTGPSCSSASTRPEHTSHTDGAVSNGIMDQDMQTEQGGNWEDVRELMVIENGVKMFFVSDQGHVTTLSQPQTLHAYQFLNHQPGSEHPPAFLQCNAWMFPMIPGRSPVLNTEPHTYMFPDITIDPKSPQSAKPRPQRAFASVGLILNPNISQQELKRFERVLKCYTDFHHYTPPPEESNRGDVASGDAPSSLASCDSIGNSGQDAMALAVRPSGPVEPAEDQTSWSSKVSKGIEMGAEIVAWGLTKGAEVGSHLMHKGSEKLKENLRPNERPVKVDEKVQDNIRQVKTVAGMACQVSATLVSAIGAMTIELGRRLAPVIVEQGGKVLPDKLKQKDDVDGASTMDAVVQVAVSGARGAATVYQGLEHSSKILYKSLQHATVETVDHKFGLEASEATNNAMGAVGYALQTYWNVDNLGLKAIAKRTAKDTGKELVNEAEKKYVTNGQPQLQ